METNKTIKIETKKEIKANNADNYEPIVVILNHNRFPIAFQNKLDELMEEGAFDNEQDAIKWIETTPIELELYYEKGIGLFAVESEAVELGGVVSPYTKSEIILEE